MKSTVHFFFFCFFSTLLPFATASAAALCGRKAYKIGRPGVAGARGSRHRTSVTGSGHNNRLNFPDHFFTIVPIFESSKHLAPPNNGGARVHARYSSAPNTIKTKKHRPLCCELSFSLSISGEPLANKSFSVEGTEREEV